MSGFRSQVRRTLCSNATAPGPEGRQIVAQRVSAGFCPTIEQAPGGATELSPFPRVPSGIWMGKDHAIWQDYSASFN